MYHLYPRPTFIFHVFPLLTEALLSFSYYRSFILVVSRRATQIHSHNQERSVVARSFKNKAPFALVHTKSIIPHTKIGPVVTACRLVTSQILWKVFWTDAECWAFGHVVIVSSQTTFCLSGKMKLRNPRSQLPSQLTYLCTRIVARAL